jgi:hypothetical protein
MVNLEYGDPVPRSYLDTKKNSDVLNLYTKVYKSTNLLAKNRALSNHDHLRQPKTPAFAFSKELMAKKKKNTEREAHLLRA